MKHIKVGLLAATAAGVMALAVARNAVSEQAAPAAKGKAAAPPASAPQAQLKAPPAAGPVVAPAATPATPAAPAGPAGKAEIKELVHDAGTIERGADISHSFTIKNVGEHDLTVDAKPG